MLILLSFIIAIGLVCGAIGCFLIRQPNDMFYGICTAWGVEWLLPTYGYEQQFLVLSCMLFLGGVVNLAIGIDRRINAS